MSESSLTEVGFNRMPLTEIINGLIAKLQEIYGTDTVLDDQSSDGQAVIIFAEALSDVLSIVEDVYASFDPAAATGAALFRLGAFSGISRITGSFGTVAVQIQVLAGQTVFAGTLVQDEVTGAQYSLNNDVGPSDNSDTWRAVSATSVLKGNQRSLIGNVTAIPVKVYGFLAVRNVVDGTSGAIMETQEQFRIRRAQSVAAPSQGITDGLRAALANIPGVGRVKVFENNGSTGADIQPGDNALPAHSLAVVVQNDVAPTVAETIALKKSQGVTLIGSTLSSVVDSGGVGQPIRYTVATANVTQIAVGLTYEELPGKGFGGVEGENIVKGALHDWIATNIDIGGRVNKYDLPTVILEAVLGADGKPTIKIVTLVLAADGVYATEVGIPWDHYASLDVANVTMTAV